MTPQTVEEEHQALAHWMAGKGYRSIATELDVSLGTAHNRVQSALEAHRCSPDFEKYRTAQLAEVSMCRQKLRELIFASNDDATLLKAMPLLFQLQKHEAKLVGLDDAPTPGQHMLEMTDQELLQTVLAWAIEDPSTAEFVESQLRLAAHPA